MIPALNPTPSNTNGVMFNHISDNILLCTDVYKFGHMEQAPEGTEYVTSYLIARKDSNIPYTIFSGFNYLAKMGLSQKITREKADEFYEYREEILGVKAPPAVVDRVEALVKLGYVPLECRTMPEGMVADAKNVVMAVRNTVKGFDWTVGLLESYFLHLWHSSTAAATSREYRSIGEYFASLTCDNADHLIWQIHDFGYRSAQGDEASALSGMGHLIVGRGTDDVLAVRMVKRAYGCTGLIGGSIAATEHSIACKYGLSVAAQKKYVLRMITEVYPSGYVSIVADSKDYWEFLTDVVGDPEVKAAILARDGKVVIRPDSGDPVKIICGDDKGPDVPSDIRAQKGTMRILEEIFGVTYNNKGYKLLNPKIGVIYGDGIFKARAVWIYQEMMALKFASSNIVFGIGGILKNHSRDDQGWAFKNIFAVINGEEVEVEKDPATDRSKKSHKGRVCLMQDEQGKFYTIDQATEAQYESGCLVVRSKDGEVIDAPTFNDVRDTYERTWSEYARSELLEHRNPLLAAVQRAVEEAR